MSAVHPLPPAEILAGVQHAYVRYRDDIEVSEIGEEQIFSDIIGTLRRQDRAMQERCGHALRVSYAKSHGLATGELRVAANLPTELRQGLFSQPCSYPVVVRLAQAPGELVDDRKASTPLGLAVKVLGVAGQMLPWHEGRNTHDFLLGSAPVFASAGPKEFLASLRPSTTPAQSPGGLARVLSLFARAGGLGRHGPAGDHNRQAGTAGVRRPLAESYFSQTPCRYSDYIAKIRLSPVMQELLQRLGDGPGVLDDEDALRTAVGFFMRQHSAEFELAVQLCTDLRTTPVEDACVDWPEHASPYRAVARLVLPPQDAWSIARQAYVDETLSFSPAHALQAHRPLGGINRGRLKAYGIMAGFRRIHNRIHNRMPFNKPLGIDELPD